MQSLAGPPILWSCRLLPARNWAFKTALKVLTRRYDSRWHWPTMKDLAISKLLSGCAHRWAPSNRGLGGELSGCVSALLNNKDLGGELLSPRTVGPPCRSFCPWHFETACCPSLCPCDAAIAHSAASRGCVASAIEPTCGVSTACDAWQYSLASHSASHNQRIEAEVGLLGLVAIGTGCGNRGADDGWGNPQRTRVVWHTTRFPSNCCCCLRWRADSSGRCARLARFFVKTGEGFDA